jgi:hypothetical protein
VEVGSATSSRPLKMATGEKVTGLLRGSAGRGGDQRGRQDLICFARAEQVGGVEKREVSADLGFIFNQAEGSIKVRPNVLQDSPDFDPSVRSKLSVGGQRGKEMEETS